MTMTMESVVVWILRCTNISGGGVSTPVLNPVKRGPKNIYLML